MRAIIIAAGMGRRLEHHTQERPKCLVQVQGRSILSYQLEALQAEGVQQLHVVRGYLAERLIVPGATYHHNAQFRDNNILHSLFCAREAIVGPLLTTYSDIVYTPQVAQAAASSALDIGLVVDTRWQEAYQGRADHPVEQAELVEVDDDMHVTRVGKAVGPERAFGEFIGLARYSEAGARAMVQAWDEVRASTRDDEPFHHALTFKKAYLTDLFHELIARGVRLGVIPIQGQWREIDTVEDLARVGQSWGQGLDV